MNDDFQKTIQDIISKVMLDEDLQEEIRDQIVNLAEATLEDSTAGNIEALSIVLSKIGDAEDYLGAQTTLNLLKIKDEMLADENAEELSAVESNENPSESLAISSPPTE